MLVIALKLIFRYDTLIIKGTMQRMVYRMISCTLFELRNVRFDPRNLSRFYAFAFNKATCRE